MGTEKYRSITSEELREALKRHQVWYFSDGEDGVKADFSFVDLSNIDLSNSFLRKAKLVGANLSGTNLSNSDLSAADLEGADLSNAILIDSVFGLTNMKNVNLEEAIYNYDKLFYALNLPEKYLDEMKIKNEIGAKEYLRNKKTRSELEVEYLKGKNDIASILNEIKSREQKNNNLSAKIKEINKTVGEKLTELEVERSRREKEALVREKTEEVIDEALVSLEEPNNYIHKEVIHHRFMYWVYLIFAFLSLLAGVVYEFRKYNDAIVDIKANPNSLLLIVYISPIILLVSLLGTFISLANKSLKNIQDLKEREREVKRMGGALKAISKLSQNDKERVDRLNIVLDNMAQNLSKNDAGLSMSENENNNESEEPPINILTEVDKLRNKVANLLN